MTQQGTHTWDLYVDYQRCPECGFINESREEFKQLKDKQTKDITCSRCNHKFTVTKNIKKTLTPFFGTPQPPEFTWK